jgi:hypothetical protein
MPAISRCNLGVVDIELDFSELTPGNGDTLQVLDIPAGCRVKEVRSWLQVAEGATLTIDVGDADNAAGYFDNLDLNTTALTRDSSTKNAAAFATGKTYLAAGILSVLVNQASGNVAKVRLEVIYEDTEPNLVEF